MEIANKEVMDTLLAIYRRAKAMGITQYSQFTCMMDLHAASSHFKMRLDDWLKADNFNFAHDFVGIQNDIDRETCRFSNRFLPRFAG